MPRVNARRWTTPWSVQGWRPSSAGAPAATLEPSAAIWHSILFQRLRLLCVCVCVCVSVHVCVCVYTHTHTHTRKCWRRQQRAHSDPGVCKRRGIRLTVGRGLGEGRFNHSVSFHGGFSLILYLRTSRTCSSAQCMPPSPIQRQEREWCQEV